MWNFFSQFLCDRYINAHHFIGLTYIALSKKTMDSDIDDFIKWSSDEWQVIQFIQSIHVPQ